MSRFLDYSPDQTYLLPPSVAEVLGADHLCFFVRKMVARLDLSEFEQAYGAEGGALFAPEMMLGVWLYAYAVGVTSARRLAQRIREDLALRYLAGGATPDNWTLSAFRRRHARGLNDVFTQVLEAARALGLGKLGRVAIDSTRVAANASRDRVDSEQLLRNQRAKIRRQVRRWQQACDGDDAEPTGLRVTIEEAEKKLASLPRRLTQLRQSGLAKRSRTDPEARFLRERGGFALGYTADLAVSDDHLILAQQVTQAATDNASVLPLVAQVQQRCGAPPAQVVADSGYFSVVNIQQLERLGVDAYIPDSNQARVLNLGGRCRQKAKAAAHRRMRSKMRSAQGRAHYARRKALVEPVFGVLKQQRGMRQFRTRGLAKVAAEWALAALAYNLTRLHVFTPA